jgi:hypothetical protein
LISSDPLTISASTKLSDLNPKLCKSPSSSTRKPLKLLLSSVLSLEEVFT